MTEIDGRTRLCGLIGDPVEHTFSPAIHNTVAEETGENLVYVPFHVASKEELPAAIQGAYALNVLGLNVTVPYKQAVIPLLKEVDPVAEAIGAVNTLVRTEGGYRGCNTDYKGLRRALEAQGVILWKHDVVIIGAGGAARAAGFMCGEAGVKRLVILNRTVEKAQSLAESIQRLFPGMEITVLPLSQAGRIPFAKCLAIQCTKAGLSPNTEETPVTSPLFFQKCELAYDCIYNPEETLFLKKVRQYGGTGWCGIDMLLYQGIEAYELWTGARVSRDAAEHARKAFGSFLHAGKKKNLVLVGFMGSGKTTVGRALSALTGCPLVDCDEQITRDSGKKVTEIFQTEGESGFRRRETALLQELCSREQEGIIYSTGGGVVISPENRKYLKKLGTVVLLDITAETVIQRLGKDSTRPLLQGPDRVKKVRTLLVRRQDAYHQAADLVVDAGSGTPDSIAEEIIARTGFAGGKV